jgi:hypothetical protein
MATRDTREAKAGEGGNLGRGNGGKEDNDGAITGAAPLSGKKPDGSVAKPRETIRANSLKAPDDNGDREAIPANNLDKVYTAESKDRWDADQPSFEDQLKAHRATNERIAKQEAKDR